ncbi:MAG: hypothetical protein AAGD43_03275 [Pseudomonadota bacterium]
MQLSIDEGGADHHIRFMVQRLFHVAYFLAFAWLAFAAYGLGIVEGKPTDVFLIGLPPLLIAFALHYVVGLKR